MEELARLMEELSLALKARAVAGRKTEALAREVQELPKLSVLVNSSDPDGSDASNSQQNEQHDDVLEKLQLQLELQNLSHAKQQAIEFLQLAKDTVAQVRQAVGTTASQIDFQCLDILDDYDNRIQYEKNSFAELQQRKQDLLFDLMKKSAKLEKLASAGDKVLKTSAAEASAAN